jgi:hypothetical protein
MSISGAPWDLGISDSDFRDAHGMAERRQQVDNCSAARRVALVGSTKMDLDEFVKIICRF